MCFNVSHPLDQVRPTERRQVGCRAVCGLRVGLPRGGKKFNILPSIRNARARHTPDVGRTHGHANSQWNVVGIDLQIRRWTLEDLRAGERLRDAHGRAVDIGRAEPLGRPTGRRGQRAWDHGIVGNIVAVIQSRPPLRLQRDRTGRHFVVFYYGFDKSSKHGSRHRKVRYDMQMPTRSGNIHISK